MSLKDVFIVHGRDHKPVKEFQSMLKEFGINSIILHEQASGSRTIVEKLEKYSDVRFAFVILTPDDVGYNQVEAESVVRYNKKHPKLKDLRIYVKEGFSGEIIDNMVEFLKFIKERARQNTILEFGYFAGMLGRDRVCCLYQGDIELPSDMQGILYIPFKKSIMECRNSIITELKSAGYSI